MAFDLNEAWGWIQKLIRRMERIESGAMLENSSITNGRMRFIGGLLRVDSGGRVEIVGTLEGEGPLGWTGRAAFDGPVEITDTLDVTAATKLRGLLELLSDLRVKSGGKITVEGANPVTLGVTSNGSAGLEFASGGILSAAMGFLAMVNGSSAVFVSPTTAALAVSGKQVSVTAAGTTITGELNLQSLPSVSASGKTPNVWIDGNGKLWKLI